MNQNSWFQCGLDSYSTTVYNSMVRPFFFAFWTWKLPWEQSTEKKALTSKEELSKSLKLFSNPRASSNIPSDLEPVMSFSFVFLGNLLCLGDLRAPRFTVRDHLRCSSVPLYRRSTPCHVPKGNVHSCSVWRVPAFRTHSILTVDGEGKFVSCCVTRPKLITAAEDALSLTKDCFGC